MATVLCISASDSSGQAGLQADIGALRAQDVGVATALTGYSAQNTKQVFDLWPIEPDLVAQQMRAVFEDMDIGAIKIGLLLNPGIMQAVASVLGELKSCPPVVLDPVIFGKKGGRVDSMDTEAIRQLKIHLFPLTTVLTPNILEAALLAGMDVEDVEDMKKAAEMLVSTGPENVLITGGHGDRTEMTDVLATQDELVENAKKRLSVTSTGGAGCALAAGIAAGLAKGDSLVDAFKASEVYVAEMISKRA